MILTRAEAFAVGDRAEAQLEALLRGKGLTVLTVADLTGRTRETEAPMLKLPTGMLVAPDFLCFQVGRPAFWVDAKGKGDPTWRRYHPGPRWEHGIDYAHAEEYREVERATGLPVWLAVYETRTPVDSARQSALVPGGQFLFLRLDAAWEQGTHRPEWPGGKSRPHDRGKRGRGGLLWARDFMRPASVN
jgi:hypothetical protein